MSSAVIESNFNQDTFTTFLTSRQEPTWVTEMRQAAWDRFSELGWPTRREEEWMRTSISKFKLNDYVLPLASETAPQDTLPTALLADNVTLGGRMVSLDSCSLQSELAEEYKAKGVLFGSLDKMLAEHGERLRPYLEKQVVDPNHDKFSALSGACWTGGTLLFVPKNVYLEKPLHVLSAMSDGGTDLNRTLVILEEGAEATLMCEMASTQADGGGLHCGTIELIVAPNASLRYVNLQNWGSKVWHFAHQKGIVDNYGRLQWTVGALGSHLAKVNQYVSLIGQDADVQVNGVMFTTHDQHLSYNTLQHHEAANCHSDLLYKTALQDISRTEWRGMIKVDAVAQKTDGYQRNDNLMLSRKTRADSIPGLEIEADDVRCTHGSTSGIVDELQVFYAMARGYSRREAVRMIVTGFFQQVIDRVTIENVREALGEAIGQRVRDLDE